MKLKIALALIAVVRSISANLAAIIHAIDYAATEKADILLTPEGSLSGYTYEFDRVEYKNALGQVEAMAKERKLWLALGTCVDMEGKCYNMLRFYLPDGTYLGCHTKILRCGSMEDAAIGKVNYFAAQPLRVFDYMGVTIGGLICNDM